MENINDKESLTLSEFETLIEKESLTLSELEAFEVETKEDLETAIKNKPQRIVLTGKIAEEYIEKHNKQKKMKKGIAIGSGIATVAGITAGILLAPATGGTSTVASAFAFGGSQGFYAMTAAGTSVTMTAGELAMIAGVTAGALGCSTALAMRLLKNYKIMEITTSGGTKIFFEQKKPKTNKNKSIEKKED